MCATLASCSLEEMVDASAPGQPLFFQLYVNRDRKIAEETIRRAEKMGVCVFLLLFCFVLLLFVLVLVFGFVLSVLFILFLLFISFIFIKLTFHSFSKKDQSFMCHC